MRLGERSEIYEGSNEHGNEGGNVGISNIALAGVVADHMAHIASERGKKGVRNLANTRVVKEIGGKVGDLADKALQSITPGFPRF